jgi:hypothetical protein
MSEHSHTPGKTPYQEARALGAKLRLAHRETRSTEEQLALLDARPGESKRERKRLQA